MLSDSAACAVSRRGACRCFPAPHCTASDGELACNTRRLQPMQRPATASPAPARFPHGVSISALARRWYYTPRSHRPYSVRQISPGDRRLLAEFALALTRTTPDRDLASVRQLSDLLFNRVIVPGSDTAVGFAALETAGAGDRVIGAVAYAPATEDSAEFCIAVAQTHREEQVGRTLLATLLRHARRVGVPQLAAEMLWSNRPMQMLAMSMGFAVEPVTRDRMLRRLVLSLK
jgi:GNAT superfamily N-acetyltransferase